MRKVGAIMIIGGGIGGIQASLDLAESGFKVYLLDTAPTIGGVMAQLDKTFPTNDCAMCIVSPKLVQCGRHHNIEVVTNARVKKVEGKAGDFRVSVVKEARYIDGQRCTGCGLCARSCPVKAVDLYNEGLSNRAAVYIPYPQAVPLVYVIDREKCIGCGLCQNICLADAIKYADEEKEVVFEVGAIILAPGFEEFDARTNQEYGYGRFPNVITSIEFERILSASGPYRGRVQRPSDGDIPERIAFIQCVGSRDVRGGNGYCSSVCCMYATKEAIIAKEHLDQIEPTIFFIDIRAHGKNFDKYVERAKKEYGVRYARSRISEVEEVQGSGNLRLSYQTEGGRLEDEEFDLVVLSVGLKPPREALPLASKLGIALNSFGFCQTSPFEPLNTSRKGIFVCGAFASPKDIPETVVQASGAASCAGELLSSARGELVTKKEYPSEIDIGSQVPRIGVFICHCGTNIGGVVNVPEVVEYAKGLPKVVFAEDNLYTCSQDTQEIMKKRIEEHHLNRVVVASCSPRTHEPLFQETLRESGLNPYVFEMANIRDQCSWVHMHQPREATEKSKDLVRMAVAKARLLTPLPRIRLKINHQALVIGGGLAGMTAALAISRQGFKVHLVEKEAELGGNLRNIHYLLSGQNTKEFLESLIDEVKSNQNIILYTASQIKEILGYLGNLKTRISTGNGADAEVEHGVVIVATGAKEYKPTEYLYGKDARVITQRELEKRIVTHQLDSVTPKSVVMIQCVGSRDEKRRYCSRICCSEAVKNALKLKALYPGINLYILNRDIRTYGFQEEYYQKAREAGIIFIHYDEADKPVIRRSKGALGVIIREPILNEKISLPADLLVLSTATVAPEENRIVAQMLKVPLNEDGFFLEAHVKLRPVDFATEGVFMCGLAHGPKSVEETISQAKAAAARAVTVLSKDKVEVEGKIAVIDKSLCSGCGTCAAVCAYQAVQVDGTESLAVVNEALCKGCGSCSSVCRSGAIDVKGFTDNQIYEALEAL